MIGRAASRFEDLDEETQRVIISELELHAGRPKLPTDVTEAPRSESLKAYIAQHGTSLHHFRLTRAVVRAMDYDSVNDTCRMLEQAELLHLPYPACWVTFRLDDFLDDPGWHTQDVPEINMTTATVTFVAYDMLSSPKQKEIVLNAAIGDHIEFRDDTGQILCLCPLYQTVLPINTGINPEVPKAQLSQFAIQVGKECVSAVACLVAALATRNVSKIIKTNTRAWRGIGNGPYQGPAGAVYLSTTTVDLPKDLAPDADHPARPGSSPKAHMRRGHVHTYLHGPGKTLTKQLWLPPIFVNADPDYVDRARRYVVGT